VGAPIFDALDFTNSNTAAAFAADLGFVYILGDRGPLTQSRIAVVLQNLGATFNAATLDLDDLVDPKKDASPFPSPVIPKIGFAAQFVDTDNIDAGFSLDVAFAGLTSGGFNPLLDAGVQVRYKRVTLNVALNVNIAEEMAGHHSLVPAIGLSWNQSIKTGGSDYLSSKGWQQTDLCIEGVFQPLSHGSNLIGGGITANLGARDDDAPVITLWPEEGGDK
jgi:hypothetical protein